MTTRPSRRQFLGLMALATAGTAVAPLGKAYGRDAGRSRYPSPGNCFANGEGVGFGPISPKLPQNGAELIETVAGNLSQTPLLELPEGFSYTAISITGQTMSDGSIVPGDHDGMACFQGRHGSHILIRNHELSPGENKFGSRVGCQPANGKVYDPFILPAGQGGGGTTTLIIDHHGRLVKHYISLGGTIRNCAGGLTPWDSWISCEENVSTPATDSSVTKKHGYNFEVPADLREAVDPIPLVDMGRFNHEANATDPRTGYVYQTEDRGDSCFYKFVPKVRRAKEFGDLQKGGRLYAMTIEPSVLATCDNTILPLSGGSVDTRRGVRSFLGQPLPVTWVKIDEVDPEGDTLRAEAQLKGAAIFSRGEGAWYADGLIYFICTGGGDQGNGQVWAYNPRRETVTLLVESTSEGALDNPDNITVAPDGTLYLCEDGGGQQYVVGVDGAGDVFKFSHNNITTSEFCGACFSDDGRFMFLNIQNPGITFVIFRDDHRPIALDHGRWHRR